MSDVELFTLISTCNDCEERFGFKPVPIVHGNMNSRIFQISQAPSQNVHLTKKPFNDSTGRKLKYGWYQISDEVFYKENNFYITALAHCFPGKNPRGGDKAPPKHCADKWLKLEMEQVNSQLIVVIGQKAASYLFKHRDFNDLVFGDHEISGKPAIVLPHPSPLNVRWFKEHPDFEKKRLPIVRGMVWDALGLTPIV